MDTSQEALDRSGHSCDDQYVFLKLVISLSFFDAQTSNLHFLASLPSLTCNFQHSFPLHNRTTAR